LVVSVIDVGTTKKKLLMELTIQSYAKGVLR